MSQSDILNIITYLNENNIEANFDNILNQYRKVKKDEMNIYDNFDIYIKHKTSVYLNKLKRANIIDFRFRKMRKNSVKKTDMVKIYYLIK